MIDDADKTRIYCRVQKIVLTKLYEKVKIKNHVIGAKIKKLQFLE